MLDFIAPLIAAVMSHNFTSSTPQLSFSPPESTYKDSYTVEVVGQENVSVYINGEQVAVTKSNGKAYITLDTSGEYNSTKYFEIILKNKNNLETQALTFSIDKAQAKVPREDAIKLLRQTSFTSYETQIDEIMLNGEMAWIDKQLSTIGSHDDLSDENYGYLERLLRMNFDIDDTTTLHAKHQKTAREIIEYPEMNFPSNYSSSWNLSKFHRNIFQERVFESEDQLRQRMALALSEIIVISPSATAGSALSLKPESLIKLYDELYKHSFGNYRDVLKETCMSSAMAYYLTYLGNKKEDAATNTAPDENFARELMQLFSIGVYKLNIDGTKRIGTDGYPIPSYTQEDVSEMARVFTGWDWWFNGAFGDTYENQVSNNFNLLHDIEYNDEWHDKGEKVVLGETISAGLGGEQEIDKAIDILMNNSNMAPHISRHFIMRFVTSNPSSAYIQRVSTAFNSGLYDGKGTGIKGDLKVMLEAILRDDEARGINQPTDFGKIDTMLLAFTHYSTRFDAKAAPYLYPGGNKVYNVYNYKWDLWIPNFPLTAGSVFNFYTNEDAPTDTYFNDNALVAPEISVHSYSNIRKFMGLRENYIQTSTLYDFYEEVNLNGTTLHHNDMETIEDWLDAKKPNLGLFMNSRDVYEDFLPLWNSGDKENAVSELIDLLSIKLLGRELPADYKAKIYSEHKSATGNPIRVFRAVTRLIVTSPYFMVID